MALNTQAYMSQALDIMARVPLIDGHNDWPHLIRGFYDNRLDERFMPDKSLAGHVDLKRLAQGRAGAVFWSAYVDCPRATNDFSDEVHYEIIRDTLQQIDLIHRLTDRYSDKLAVAYSSEQIFEIFNEGKVASLIGVEGLHQIGNSSSVLRMYHRLGVRYVTLTHNQNNLYADSATAKVAAHGGLSPAGKAMIREMNRIGMMIDLSHVSEATMLAVLEISLAPVIFSHSSAFGLVESSRNASDLCLQKLKANNGVIMISLIPALTHSDVTRADLTHVVDHILYVAEKIGFDHIGIGSDFDGMVNSVNGLKDVSKYPKLVATMLCKGIRRSDVEKVIGLNTIRVLKEVEDAGHRYAKALPVLEDEVKQLWDENVRAFVRSRYPAAEHDARRASHSSGDKDNHER